MGAHQVSIGSMALVTLFKLCQSFDNQARLGLPNIEKHVVSEMLHKIFNQASGKQ